MKAKYVRTKDGKIYEIVKETENSFECEGPFEKKMNYRCIIIKSCLSINEKFDYKLANTIEELCDEFVYEEKKDKTNKQLNIELLKEYKDEYVIYGAIWTDFGLKYVAKMNEKGKLELL